MHFRVRDLFGLGFLVAAMLSTDCGLFTGPSGSMAGNWSAPGSGHSGLHYEMSLEQEGAAVKGVMCSADSTFLGYHDQPVTGEYPRVSFTVITPGGPIRSFSGKFEDDRGQIAGNFTVPFGGSPEQLRFVRSNTGHCEGARSFP